MKIERMNKMSFLLEFLPIIIYILLIIVLLIGIILAIKCIITLDKVEKVVDNTNEKLKSLDGIFHIIDSTTDRVVLITDKVIEGITSLVTNLFTPKKTTKPSKSKKELKNKEKVENESK